jgi:hypothetical protein
MTPATTPVMPSAMTLIFAARVAFAVSLQRGCHDKKRKLSVNQANREQILVSGAMN